MQSRRSKLSSRLVSIGGGSAGPFSQAEFRGRAGPKLPQIEAVAPGPGSPYSRWMEQYELKFYGPRVGPGSPNAILAVYSFSLANNLLAIEHAKSAFLEAVAGCAHAVLRHERHGVIWEDMRTDAQPPPG